MNVPSCAYMTNLLFTHKIKVNIKVTRRQNLAQNQMLAHFKILAHFKGICAEFVFTFLFFIKHMYFTQNFLLTQESPFILAYTGTISLLWKLRIFFDTNRHPSDGRHNNWHGRPLYLCAENFESNELYGLVQCHAEMQVQVLFTAAGVVPCGGRKTSPRTSTIVQFIFYFGPLRSAIIF